MTHFHLLPIALGASLYIAAVVLGPLLFAWWQAARMSPEPWINLPRLLRAAAHYGPRLHILRRNVSPVNEEVSMNSHVAPDIMDAYVAGCLGLEQRDAVEHHTSECQACARGLAMAEFSWKVYRRIRTLLFDEDENDLKGDVNGSAADIVKNLNCCSEQ